MTKREMVATGLALTFVVVALLLVVVFPEGELHDARGSDASETRDSLEQDGAVLSAEGESPEPSSPGHEGVPVARREALSEKLTLDVFVTDRAGAPLPEAHVFLLTAEDMGVTHETDAKGHVLLEDLPSETGRISVFLSGHDRVTRDFDLTESDSVTVRLGRSYGLQVRVVDPLGKPAPGVRLRLALSDVLDAPAEKFIATPGRRGFFLPRTLAPPRGLRFTDEEGTAQFRGSSSWVGRMLRLEIYGPTPCEGAVEIPWDAGHHTLRLSRSPWSIVGTVRDATGEPLTPTLSWEGPSIADPPVIGSDGSFRASGLLTDEVVLSFDLFLYTPRRIVVRSPSAAQAAYPLELDVVLERGRLVVLDLSHGSTEGLDVWLLSQTEEALALSVQRQQRDSYLLVGVPERDVRLRVEVGGEGFELFCSAAAEHLQLVLPEPGQLTVRAPNSWRGGAQVQVRKEGGSGRGMVEQLYHRELGLEARFPFVLPGIYLVTHEDEELAPLRVDVRPGAHSEISFEAWMRSPGK